MLTAPGSPTPQQQQLETALCAPLVVAMELGCSLVGWHWEGCEQVGGSGGTAQEGDSGGGAKGTKLVCSSSFMAQALGCEPVESTQSRALNSLILFNEQSLVKARILLLDLFPVFFFLALSCALRVTWLKSRIMSIY